MKKKFNNIEIFDDTKIYVMCPAYVKTGGPELLNQLVNNLTDKGYEAYIVYHNIDEGNKEYTPKDFLIYNNKYVLEHEIEDNYKNILITPETNADIIVKYSEIRTVIWWLSVDHYPKSISKKDLLKQKRYMSFLKRSIYDWSEKKIFNRVDYNLVQSFYAMDWLKKEKKIYSLYLSDYINDSYLQNNDNFNVVKENNVLYNPKKGFEFTKKIMDRFQNFNWIPIQNLTTSQVKELLLSSKVYIDFGNHPGKDRFPREAAISNCCVITGKRGSAKFDKDIPIPSEFKYEDVDKNIEDIGKKIELCLTDYTNQQKKYEDYKEFIRSEKEKFREDIDKIFVKK